MLLLCVNSLHYIIAITTVRKFTHRSTHATSMLISCKHNSASYKLYFYRYYGNQIPNVIIVSTTVTLQTKKKLSLLLLTEIDVLLYTAGGLACRGILETSPNHNVKTFISLSSPQGGQFGGMYY